jgi:hypothetical protein
MVSRNVENMVYIESEVLTLKGWVRRLYKPLNVYLFEIHAKHKVGKEEKKKSENIVEHPGMLVCLMGQ